MIDISIYDNINGLSDIRGFIYPKTYVFSVAENDYSIGYTTRYFVQKINEGPVMEVSSENYILLSAKLFNKVVVTWVLIGPEKNVFVNGKLYEYGVYERNRQEIMTQAKTMPDLKNKITNYTQYVRPTSS